MIRKTYHFLKRQLWTKKHASNTTAMVSFSWPITTGIEKIAAHMSTPVSLKSRALNTVLMYAGLSKLKELRDYSLRRTGCDTKGKRIRALHDVCFAIPIAGVVKPVIYLASGETDPAKIAIGTLGTMGMAALLSPAMGLYVDVFNGLTGAEKYECMPDLLERSTSKTKKRIVSLALAASIGLTSLVYSLTPWRYEKQNQGYQEPKTKVVSVEQQPRNPISGDLENKIR